MAEYYFARHWSLSSRLKYYETGVSFYKQDTHSGGWFDLGTDENYGNFEGAVITVPVNIKWEFRVYKNFAASIKLGAAYNVEVKSNYGPYSEGARTDYSRHYASSNAGYGLNYFINKNFAAYIDVEGFIGQSKGKKDGFLGQVNYRTRNNFLNFGVKYTFDKAKQTMEIPIENPVQTDPQE